MQLRWDNKSIMMSAQDWEVASAALGSGPSSYVLKDTGATFTRQFWLAQRIGCAFIGSTGGDVWWRRAEKAATKLSYGSITSAPVIIVNNGGGGGGEKTCGVHVELFNSASFHAIFQRRGEYNLSKMSS